MRKHATLIQRTGCPDSIIQNSKVKVQVHSSIRDTSRSYASPEACSGSAVESHQPSPLNQHVSSMGSSVRNDRTASAPPLAKAAFKRLPASGSCGPTHDIKAALDKNRAGHIAPWAGLSISSMPPMQPTACMGKMSLPCGRRASNQVQLGWVIAAFT